MYRIISFFNTSVASVERLCGQLHSKRVARTSQFVRFVYRERFVRFVKIRKLLKFLKISTLRSNDFSN